MVQKEYPSLLLQTYYCLLRISFRIPLAEMEAIAHTGDFAHDLRHPRVVRMRGDSGECKGEQHACERYTGSVGRPAARHDAKASRYERPGRRRKLVGRRHGVMFVRDAPVIVDLAKADRQSEQKAILVRWVAR